MWSIHLDIQCTVEPLLNHFCSGISQVNQQSTAILEGLLEPGEVERPFEGSAERGLLIANPLDVRPVMNSTQNKL